MLAAQSVEKINVWLRKTRSPSRTRSRNANKSEKDLMHIATRGLTKAHIARGSQLVWRRAKLPYRKQNRQDCATKPIACFAARGDRAAVRVREVAHRDTVSSVDLEKMQHWSWSTAHHSSLDDFRAQEDLQLFAILWVASQNFESTSVLVKRPFARSPLLSEFLDKVISRCPKRLIK